jgi:hypothetical protein
LWQEKKTDSEKAGKRADREIVRHGLRQKETKQKEGKKTRRQTGRHNYAISNF